MIHEALENLAENASYLIAKETGRILIVSHFDADGICAGSIAYKALESLNKSFDIIFIKQLELDILKDIAKYNADLFWFTDLGSGQIDNINKYLSCKKIVISDHHQVGEITGSENENTIINVNPHFFNINGNDEISGAGVTYLVAEKLSNSVNEYITLTLVGATGDIQKTKDMFKSLNLILLENAVKLGKIKVKKGLRLFGRTSKPLYKCLQHCKNPIIPDVTENESGAFKLMHYLKIPARQENGSWTTLGHLSQEQEITLSTEIILRSNTKTNKDLIIGNVYILPNNYEIREFATMLNACGRLEKSKAGMELCLGIRDSIDDILVEYRQKIAKYISYITKNKEMFIKTRVATYLIAKDNIDENFIGTVLSMLSHSEMRSDITIGLANATNGIKISGRASASLSNRINLGESIKKASMEIGGEGGGHSLAGGGKIPLNTEERFIKLLDNLLQEQLNNSNCSL